ncbi:MAG: hypothetical protein ABIQ58_06745 [Candidatus Limnocylindrales bacterium]
MNTVRSWATLAGVVLVATGLLGFLGTPLVGAADGALIPTDSLHNVVHLGTGLMALAIAFGTAGRTQVDAVLGFGILYVSIFAAVLVSPTLMGLFTVPANVVIHVIHATVAIVSLGVALMARNAGLVRT